MTNYAVLANTTAVLHITIVALVIVGLLVCYRNKRFRPWEAAVFIIVILLWSYYGNCPLTILEQYFRDLAGQHVNLSAVGFLPYYANKFFDVSFSSALVRRATFFTGGTFFIASIEWFAPFFHMEVFKIRKLFRKQKNKNLAKRRG